MTFILTHRTNINPGRNPYDDVQAVRYLPKARATIAERFMELADHDPAYSMWDAVIRNDPEYTLQDCADIFNDFWSELGEVYFVAVYDPPERRGPYAGRVDRVKRGNHA
jgi:hypothetical protein